MSDQKTIDERLALPVLELIELAQKEVSALNHGKRWRMSIPVDVDDSDLVISGALNAAAKAIGAVSRGPAPDVMRQALEDIASGELGLNVAIKAAKKALGAASPAGEREQR